MTNRICSIPDCGSRYYEKGLCSLHYDRKRHGIDMMLPKRKPSGYKDGRQEHPLYRSYVAMRQRCNNPNDKSYKNYGGRRIKVCKRWDNVENGFPNFLEDMGERPEGYSLDRIDNDGDYTPENCKWATRTEQQNNRRSNRLITINGRTRTFTQWVREQGCTTVRQAGHRFYDKGWSIERTLQTEIK
jgi:hypothetical protein